MPFEEQHQQSTDLSDIGGNFADLAVALAGTPLALIDRRASNRKSCHRGGHGGHPRV